jgi:hypothetical protein
MDPGTVELVIFVCEAARDERTVGSPKGHCFGASGRLRARHRSPGSRRNRQHGDADGRFPATLSRRSATTSLCTWTEALNDHPLGLYDVTVKIVKLEQIEDGTLVTSYYDWSSVEQSWKDANIFPVISEGALRATLGILARTVAPGTASAFRLRYRNETAGDAGLGSGVRQAPLPV